MTYNNLEEIIYKSEGCPDGAEIPEDIWEELDPEDIWEELEENDDE